MIDNLLLKKETKPPFASFRSETAVGSRLAAQPRQLQVGRGDSNRMQAGHPTLPRCALLFSAFSLRLFTQRQKSFSLLSARCLPPVFPALPESHSNPMHSQPLLLKVTQTRRLDSNLNCLHLSTYIYKLGGEKKQNQRELARFYIFAVTYALELKHFCNDVVTI